MATPMEADMLTLSYNFDHDLNVPIFSGKVIPYHTDTACMMYI